MACSADGGAATLTPAIHDRLLARLGWFEVAGRPQGVDHITAIADGLSVLVIAGPAQALVVGGHDHIALLDQGFHRRQANITPTRTGGEQDLIEGLGRLIDLAGSAASGCPSRPMGPGDQLAAAYRRGSCRHSNHRGHNGASVGTIAGDIGNPPGFATRHCAHSGLGSKHFS